MRRGPHYTACRAASDQTRTASGIPKGRAFLEQQNTIWSKELSRFLPP
jgi:hypothetical protein